MTNKTISIISNRCCGCRACEQKCPKQAISCKESNEGFLYPVIDENKCTNCSLCLNTCPVASIVEEKDFSQQYYAVWAQDKQVLKNSSSGGVFYPLAESFIKRGGYVCGCINDENCLPKHILTNNAKDLLKMQGSKYVESYIGHIYLRVREKLNEGIEVLFTGTPCQVAGLYKFLEKPFANLTSIDIICHGVPSRLLFSEYLKWQAKVHKGKITDYRFRSKDKHDWSLTYKMTVSKTHKNKVVEHMASLDPYYYSFLQGITYRESCYTCKYSSMNRVSDITIGDFWGIEQLDSRLNNPNGVSAVIINTNKGEAVFSNIKYLFFYESVCADQIKKCNGNLIAPTKRPQERTMIYLNLREQGFARLAKKDLKHKRYFVEKIKDYIPNRIRQKIKKIIRKRG